MEDLRKLFDFFFYNCLLKDFKLFKFTRFQTFFIIGRRKFLQKRKFSGLVSKFYLAMLLSLRPPIAKSLRACNNFWKCYTMRSILVLFRKQNLWNINQLVFELEIQLFRKRSKKVSIDDGQENAAKVSEAIIIVSLRKKGLVSKERNLNS